MFTIGRQATFDGPTLSTMTSSNTSLAAVFSRRGVTARLAAL